MKISSIVDITGGQLLNSPSISFTSGTHTNIKKVGDGDLFISSNPLLIEEALKKGAFAIIFDCFLDITNLDTEIAWIKVDNINRTITKLLRFKLATKKLKSYSVDFIAYEFLQVLGTTTKNIYFVNDIFSSLEALQYIDDEDILVSTNTQFLEDIYPKSEHLQINNMKFGNLLIHSIFETSFLYKEEYFYKLRIPYIYLNHLLSIKETFSIEEIDGQKLKNIPFMQPIFINKQNRFVEYGKSNRFILTANNDEIAKIEFEFISIIFKYGKSSFIEAKNLDDDMIFNLIIENRSNCLYFKNITNEKIIDILRKNEIKEQTLF